MSPTDHTNALQRITKTLERIVTLWPEIRTSQLLDAARALPAIMAELPLRESTTERAVGLYVEILVDNKFLPPWCG